MNQLRKSIMRRVYYAYAISLIAHPFFIHGLVLGVSVSSLSKRVSIPNIWINMMDVKVGDLAGFWIGAFRHTGVLTLVLTGITLLTIFSLVMSFYRRRFISYSTVSVVSDWTGQKNLGMS